MSIFVFTGPTIPATEARRWLDATYLPPVSQGDIVSLLRQKPRAIGIIDGYFDSVPAVWHKEILLALSQGVRVAGAASMGALRAAELHPFGMEGVGEIFEWYRDGVIEADDEVAVHHGPAEVGYRSFNEPLVNIRRTLGAACERGLISPATLAELVAIGRELPYWERSYERLLERARARGLSGETEGALRAFIEEGAIDLKRRDAVALLRHLATAGEPAPTPPPFELQETVFLSRLIDRDQTIYTHGEHRVTAQTLVTHARLDLEGFAALRQRAAMNGLALDFARQLGLVAGEEELASERAQLEDRLGIAGEEGLMAWRERNHLTQEEFDQLLEELALTRKLQQLYGSRSSNRMLLQQLRVEGQYEALVRSASEKLSHLATYGHGNRPPADLLDWYFERRGEGVPADIHAYAAGLGFQDYAAFMLALEEHYWYHRGGAGPHEH